MSPALFSASVSFFFPVFRYDRRMRNDGHEVHEKHGFWGLVLSGRLVGFLEFLSSFLASVPSSYHASLLLIGLMKGVCWYGQDKATIKRRGPRHWTDGG